VGSPSKTSPLPTPSNGLRTGSSCEGEEQGIQKATRGLNSWWLLVTFQGMRFIRDVLGHYGNILHELTHEFALARYL
jgi:hypothetical protein